MFDKLFNQSHQPNPLILMFSFLVSLSLFLCMAQHIKSHSKSIILKYESPSTLSALARCYSLPVFLNFK